MQKRSRLALLIEDFVLISVSYRHGNFGRVGVEALNESFPLLGSGKLQLMRVVSQGVAGGQAIPFPLQVPDPRPSGLGAGRWGCAMGVALP
jgi:hypothetical protein